MSGQSVLILKICAVIIVIGLLILAFDKYFVRRDVPTKAERLSEVSSALALTDVSGDAELQRRLLAVLQGYPAITGKPQSIQVILSQPGSAHQLWLIEFSSREFALYRGQGQTSRVDVPLFAILLEFEASVELPAWIQGEGSPAPTPPFNEQSLSSLGAMADFRLAVGGRHALFVSQLQAPALLQAMNQSVSPEFHAGLLNSALQIDVQRAIDIINSLDTSLPELPRFYRIDEPKVRIELPSTAPISAAMDQAAAEMQLEIEAQAQRWEEQNAERTARWEQERREIRERQTNRMAQRKADSEAKMAEIRANMQRSMEQAKERAKAPEKDQ